MTDNQKLAEMLFPDIKKTPSDYELIYPKRDLPSGAQVTRFAPSPTGFLHIGGLFASLVCERCAHRSGGVFYLRIEDTDKKREIEDGVTGILEGLSAFGITPDEGMTGPDSEKGDYGPYKQSMRRDIYHAFAKFLTEKGYAYPCFCSEGDISKIREEQEKTKLLPGYYGKFAKCRSLSIDEVERKIKAGEEYTVRLKSPGEEGRRIAFDDKIKGHIEMPENIVDIVLLKSDGIPTYHFAHAVDDFLMRTTNVIRGDEWISSVPVHLQLFELLGNKAPAFSHISPIMKEDNGAKRKISKRKDPEAAVTFYEEEGYPKEAVTEYLLNLANYNFEDWRRENPNASYTEFPFDMSKMSSSGALFDMVKLRDVSRGIISRFSAEKVLDDVLSWSEKYDRELYDVLSKDRDFAIRLFGIDRGGDKPRKDIAAWSDVRAYVSYFYDSLWDRQYELPENISADDAVAVLEEYKNIFSPEDDKDTWFSKMKDVAEKCGFAREVKMFKKNPDDFKGHVGDVSTIVRVAITGRRNSPDLHAILALLGKDRVMARISSLTSYLKSDR